MDFKLGDKVLLVVINTSKADPALQYQATVVGIDDFDHTYLLGWKLSKPPFVSGKSSIGPSIISNARWAIDLDTYDFTWWYVGIHKLEYQLQPLSAGASVSVKSGGMKCASCSNFNNYAEPNMGEKFVCFSCKSSGRHRYLLT